MRDTYNYYGVFLDGGMEPIHVFSSNGSNATQSYSLLPDGYELLLTRHYVITVSSTRLSLGSSG